MANPPPIAELTGTWDYTTLPDTVQLGPGVFIERRETFRRYRSRRQPGLVLGANVTVLGWSEISVEPDGVLEVGDRTVLVGAVFMCAERITVGADVVISYGATIADCDFHPLAAAARRRDAVAVAPGGDPTDRVPLLTTPVTVGDGARIGIGAIVLKGVTIGPGAEVAAGAVVTRSVEPGTRVEGNPAVPRGPAGTGGR